MNFENLSNPDARKMYENEAKRRASEKHGKKSAAMDIIRDDAFAEDKVRDKARIERSNQLQGRYGGGNLEKDMRARASYERKLAIRAKEAGIPVEEQREKDALAEKEIRDQIEGEYMKKISEIENNFPESVKTKEENWKKAREESKKALAEYRKKLLDESDASFEDEQGGIFARFKDSVVFVEKDGYKYYFCETYSDDLKRLIVWELSDRNYDKKVNDLTAEDFKQKIMNIIEKIASVCGVSKEIIYSKFDFDLKFKTGGNIYNDFHSAYENAEEYDMGLGSEWYVGALLSVNGKALVEYPINNTYKILDRSEFDDENIEEMSDHVLELLLSKSQNKSLE